MKKELLAWLAQYKSATPNFGLDRMHVLLAYRDNPHKKVPVIHIAGTNGKGSTIACLSQLLQARQLKVGVFSSPYIVDYNEQLTINGHSIDDSALQSLVDSYQAICEQHSDEQLQGLTEFELMTAMAYDYFYQQQVDVAIIEVGMGGLLDSTNVCEPLLTGITTIGLDHVDLLGDTLSQIATQKGGIIKENVPLVTGNIENEALLVLEHLTQQRHSQHIQWQVDFKAKQQCSGITGENFHFKNAYRSGDFFVNLVGYHQIENAAMAMMLADTFCQLKNLSPLTNQAINHALESVVWYARMEIVSIQPLTMIDGAHNPHAMKRLVENMNTHYHDYHKHIIFSCIKTKDIHQMLTDLETIQNATIYITTFEDERAVDDQVLQQLANEKGLKLVSWQQFLRTTTWQDNDMILITGSLYFLMQVRRFILEEKHG